MSTHNIGFCEGEAILINTHNIGFYKDLTKIIFQYHQICTLSLLLGKLFIRKLFIFFFFLLNLQI